MFRLAVFLFLLCPCIARADVIPWDFGAPIPLDARRAKNVGLQSETFRAQIFYDYATATATYHFRNDGAATTVAMAFAGEQPRDPDDVKGASYLRVRVDGKSVPFRRVSKGKMFSAVTRYLGNVRFERGQARVMQVEIRTQKFWSYAFDADLKYKFAGSKWKGTTRSDIGIEVRAPGTFLVNAFQGDTDYFEEKDAVPFGKSGASCRLQSKLELGGSLLFTFVATLVPDWLIEAGDKAGFSNKFEQTIVVPGDAQGFYQAAFWLPDALIEDGVAYVRLDHFTNYGFSEQSEKNTAHLSWNKQTNSATLRAYGHRLEVTKNSLNARIDGRALVLKGKPFTAEESGHEIGYSTPIYAPLLDVARALGGSANVNQKAHRFYIALPKPATL